MSLSDEDRAEIAALVKVATEEAIVETFKVLGLDVNNFEHIEQFRENHVWVKKYRKASEAVGSRVLVTITTIMTGGALAAIWTYLRVSGN